MSLDPKDFILSSHLVDTKRVASVMTDIVETARKNPLSAMTLAVDTGTTLQSVLSQSTSLLNSTVLPSDYLSSVGLSLATLGQSTASLTSLNIANQFASTINSLNTIGNIGVGVQNILNSPALAASAKLPELSLGAAAFQLGIADTLKIANTITAPYLASSSAVFHLETSFARVLAEQQSALSSMSDTLRLQPQIASLHASVLSMSDALRDTWDSIRIDANRLSAIPASFLQAHAVELYTAAQTSTAISLPAKDISGGNIEIEETLDKMADSFEGRLAAVHQGLVITYRGGVKALETGGTDWQRHAMVSFRELSTHALRILAPDDEVLKCARPEDLHEGRPTRRARLNYIFAGIIADLEIAKFYDADMKAALELFEILNSGTHRLEQSATPAQVHYLRCRVVGLLTAMLEARGY